MHTCTVSRARDAALKLEDHLVARYGIHWRARHCAMTVLTEKAFFSSRSGWPGLMAVEVHVTYWLHAGSHHSRAEGPASSSWRACVDVPPHAH